MKDDKPTIDNMIELRSEKTQKLIGEIPPSLIRLGSVVIAIIFIALIASICLIPYPYSDGESILSHLLTAGIKGQ